MILQALTRYYEDLLSRGEIAAPGWAPAKISFALCLNENGELTQIVPTMDEVSKGKKTVFQPQLITLPAAVKRTVSIAANFLWDNSAYLLGVDQKGKPERSRECFATAAKLHHAVLDSVDSPNARAILAFFDTWKPEHAAEHPALIRQLDDVTAGGNLVFRVDGRKVEEDTVIREAWQRYQDGGEVPGLSDNDLRAALKRLANGLPCDGLGVDPNRPFYILGLAPNAARLSVRFFLRDSFGKLMENVNAHYERMEIVRPAYEKFNYLPLWSLLRETVNLNSRDKAPSPAMAGATARAIFSGARYPASLSRHFAQKHLKFVCYRKNVHSDLYTFAVAPRKGRGD